MQSISSSKTADVNVDSLAALAVESWRLNRWIASKTSDDSLAIPKQMLRRLNKLLEECNVTVEDLTGRPFDPGLAAEVVDVVPDDGSPADVAIIVETIAPIVMWNNIAVKHALVVIRQNPSVTVEMNCEEQTP